MKISNKWHKRELQTVVIYFDRDIDSISFDYLKPPAII